MFDHFVDANNRFKRFLEHGDTYLVHHQTEKILKSVAGEVYV